jgi:hypothetical protein
VQQSGEKLNVSPEFRPESPQHKQPGLELFDEFEGLEVYGRGPLLNPPTRVERVSALGRRRPLTRPDGKRGFGSYHPTPGVPASQRPQV